MSGRISGLLGCLIFIVLIFIAGSAHFEPKLDLKGEVTFWMDDREPISDIIEAFEEEYPDVKLNTIYIPDKENTLIMVNSLKSGECTADVVELNSRVVKDMVLNNNICEDLTKRASKISKDMVPYTLDVAKDENGRLRALSSSINPCGIGFKREIAKKYLGTDDPEKIEKMLSTPEKMLETAKILKDNSDGKVALFPTYVEVKDIYFGQRKNRWVEGDKITIDNKVLEYIEFSKKLAENNYEASKRKWSSEWASAIAVDEVAMCWSIPSWGIKWVIESNDQNALNGGKWGIVKQNSPSYVDGAWYAINSNSKNKELAWEFIKFITSDKRFLNKMLKKYSYSIPNNMEIIKSKSNSNEIDPVLGQNKYKVFGEGLKSINGKLCTQYDFDFDQKFDVLLDSYINGEIKTKEELIEEFKKSAQAIIEYYEKANEKYKNWK